MCDYLWQIVAAANTFAALAVSVILDNFPPIASWWAGIPSWAKKLLYAGVTIVLGVAAYAIGLYAMGCEGWAGWEDALCLILSAALAWFAGAYRHERAKV